MTRLIPQHLHISTTHTNYPIIVIVLNETFIIAFDFILFSDDFRLHTISIYHTYLHGISLDLQKGIPLWHFLQRTKMQIPTNITNTVTLKITVNCVVSI